MVSAGKLRKPWDSLSELRSSVCERRLERTVLRPAILPVKTAQFTQFCFSSGMKSDSEIAQFNCECIPLFSTTHNDPLLYSSISSSYTVKSRGQRYDIGRDEMNTIICG